MSKEVAKQIRDGLKVLGLSSRQVSVQADSNGANVRIKDFSVNFNQVKELAKQFEEIRRCEYSGDILSGGNTYISISYDWQAEKALKESQEYKDHLNWVTDKLFDLKENVGIELVKGFKVFKHYNGYGYHVEVDYSDRPWIGFNGVSELAFELFVQLQQKSLLAA